MLCLYIECFTRFGSPFCATVALLSAGAGKSVQPVNFIENSSSLFESLRGFEQIINTSPSIQGKYLEKGFRGDGNTTKSFIRSAECPGVAANLEVKLLELFCDPVLPSTHNRRRRCVVGTKNQSRERVYPDSPQICEKILVQGMHPMSKGVANLRIVCFLELES
ncbi:hypothetical protein CDAR_570731 [Caerostris darwini]|uniref:Uncharacterized protein n=1 Tax=Caerostris darwini TaxID=1538125 RepID=A0AAV4QCT7_9ARAC|nr:hypothetical protein CDAR_570731 [Caerostris darwini]